MSGFPKLLPALLLFISIILPADEGEDYNAVSKCQKTLLARKVANGEFSEAILEKAITLPVEFYGSEEEQGNIKRLFDRLGAEKFEDREAATAELTRKHNAPAFIGLLLKQTKDPEVIGRAREIVRTWKEKNPDDGFNLKLKMWMGCPSSIVKLKTFSDINMEAQKHDRHQAIYDAGRSLDLDDFPESDRINAVVLWLNELDEKRPSVSALFFQQLKRGEWNDKSLQGSLAKVMRNEENGFYGNEFNELILNIPEDLNPKDFQPLLASADKRKGAIAALLVKTGDKEALPAFIELLNHEWSTLTADKGKVRGGGHSMYYSPFYQFDIFKMPSFRKFAPEILKGIGNKFSDDRVAIHDAYLNIVRFFADTDSGMGMLEELSANKCPQTAIAASLMLYGRNGKDEVLESLLKSLNAATPQDVMNNNEELEDLIRTLRGKMSVFPEKAGYYRKFIESAGAVLLENVLNAPPDSAQRSSFDFFIDEMLPFGLIGIDRQKVIAMLSNYSKFDWWAYPESAVRFLLQDAVSKDDVNTLLGQLAALAMKPGAKPAEEVLFVDFAMMAGQFSAVEPMKDKLKGMLSITGEGKSCPPQIRKMAWILSPEMVISSPQPFEWGPDYLLLNGKGNDYAALAAKIDGQGKEYKSQLFRLSYGLDGTDLSTFKDLKEYDSFSTFCEMSWKNLPTEPAMRDKLYELCEKMTKMESTWQSSWQTREYLKNMPELLRKFGIRIDEIRKGNTMLILLESELAFRRGDAKACREAFGRAMANPDLKMSEYLMMDFDRHEMILELAEGVISENTGRYLSAPRKNELEGGWYRLASILYENGHAEKAREFRKIAPAPRASEKWDYSESCLSWAWNEAVAGNFAEAAVLSETALLNARSKGMGDYAIMMRRLLNEAPGELKEFLKVLSMKKDFTRRLEYGNGLAKFADQAKDKDLRALSAFMAARLAVASGRDGKEARRLWTIGAEAGGMHSGYCKDAMNAVPEEKKKFNLSSSWYNRDSMPGEMTPFTNSFGICYKADKPMLTVKSLEWYGPYGIPVSKQILQYFCDGSGYWVYIRDQGKAWIPGEWSIIVRHQDGIEYYQRTLLPYGEK